MNKANIDHSIKLANKSTIIGVCGICGNTGKLTFEHIPPNSAFNNKPILVQKHNHLFDEKSPQYKKHMKQNKGMGKYSLCRSCNSLTGDWYARDFCDFVKQEMDFINKMKSAEPLIRTKLKIKPLNVFKQIVTMFMTADYNSYLLSRKDVTSYLLNKESQDFPKDFNLYLYTSISKHKRITGMSVAYNTDTSTTNYWAEIAFNPFGYLLARHSSPPKENMMKIDFFNNYSFGESIEIDFETPFLKIDGVFPGNYL